MAGAAHVRPHREAHAPPGRRCMHRLDRRTATAIPQPATLCDRSRMTLPAPTYDLMLLLDPQAEETARAKIVADTRSAIEAQGELLRYDPWGERPLAYPIEKKN